MDSKFIPASSSSPSLQLEIRRSTKINLFLATNLQAKKWVGFKCQKTTRSYGDFSFQWMRSLQVARFSSARKPYVMKKEFVQVEEESGKKGTIAGAVALIIGTSIGSGILELPKKASPAGLLPSSVCMIICWTFLLVEALLLVEINVALQRRNRERKGGGGGGEEGEGESEMQLISMKTMAQETLGDWGGTFVTVLYVFFGYTSLVAYSSKSGEILFHLINLPESVSGFLFTVIFSLLVSIGGSQATDQVNQWLTACMIGLLLAIEVLAVFFGGWQGFGGVSDWGNVPATIPVMIFSLVYHDLAPFLCAYLGGDLARLRVSVLLGSLIPLAALLVWDAIALGLSHHVDQPVDPVELLTSVKWSGVPLMVEAFSLLAVGTSIIGTLLGFSEFLKEQIKSSLSNPAPRELQEHKPQIFGVRRWWEKNGISFAAMAMVVAPALFVSTTVPDAFSAATDIAGGYCMTLLYGVIPPMMAWQMNRQSKEAEGSEEQKTLWKAKPALVTVGILACGIVIDQILQDLLGYRS